ncbi:IgA FC receptor [uncultured Gemella sp.]|uniref:IgA FC receptor n=1 Tax=uncultured Gemella sp. TaxID=254352 RepID=UPI0028D4722E|nr:IgA FC receptor [uncultured Gemella sp.]
MSRNKNHSSRKVIVAITGALMGIVAGSVGTVYAQGNDINSGVEMRNKETEDHLNNLNNLNEIASKSIEKASELLNYEKNEKNIINEKIDWEFIDGREFLNQIISNVENADKEQKIKRMWLTTINELLAIYPENENLRKIKIILEEDIKKDENSSENKKENQEVPKAEDKKEVKKDENSSENKKENQEAPKAEDKKEVKKDENSSENKKENQEAPKAEDKKEAKKDENSSEGKKENQEAPKVEDKKEAKKDENSSEGKKRNEKTPKSGDKKEIPKKQTVPENKNEETNKEDTKVTSDTNKSVNDVAVNNHVLTAKLSGRDVTVSFDKNKIKADEVFVGAINDENLNKEIINKLGNEYKVVEVFEIHFKKDGKKLDSDVQRTVKVSVVKNNDAKLEVYHIADNNVLEKIDSNFTDGVVEFKIKHFSKFAILERIRVGTKDLESRVQIVTPVKAEYNEEKIATTKNSNVNNKKENEDLPKTGLETTEALGSALLALGAAIAIRRRQMQ